MLPVSKGGLQRIRIINLLLVWVFMTEKEALDEDFKMICLLIIYRKYPARTKDFLVQQKAAGRNKGVFCECLMLSLDSEGFHHVQVLISSRS